MTEIDDDRVGTAPPPNTEDADQIRMLVIFHYVLAGLVALFACLPLIHVALGTAMITGYIPDANTDPMARLGGFFFVAVGGFLSLLGWSFAGLLVWSARNLGAFRRWTACLVVAAVMCTFAPFGTVLGVFTILVLMRPSVKARFPAASPEEPVA